MAQIGFILNPAPEDAARTKTREEAIAAVTAAGGVEILDTVLISFRTTDGIFADERLAWAISLDPSTAQGPPVSGPAPVFGGRHQDPGDLTRSRVLKYSVDFYDAMTGEFLVAATKSGVAE